MKTGLILALLAVPAVGQNAVFAPISTNTSVVSGMVYRVTLQANPNYPQFTAQFAANVAQVEFTNAVLGASRSVTWGSGGKAILRSVAVTPIPPPVGWTVVPNHGIAGTNYIELLP